MEHFKKMFFKPYIIWSAAQDPSSVAWRNDIAPALTSTSARYLQFCMRRSYLIEYYIIRPMQTPVTFRNDFSSSSLWSHEALLRFWIFFCFQVLNFQKLSTAAAKTAPEVTHRSTMVLRSTSVSVSRCPANFKSDL